jgi:hypothetical protein
MTELVAGASKRRVAHTRRLAAIGVVFVALAGCGGGGGTSNTGTTTSTGGSTTVTGRVVKGPVAGAQVCAYPVGAAGDQGSSLGCSQTDSSGGYSLNLGTFSGLVVLHATGGTYVNEADGQPTALAQLTGAVTATSGAAITASVTPLTTIALARAQSSGLLSAGSWEAAAREVAAAYGVSDIVATSPADPLAATSAQATDAARTYGIVLAGLAHFASQQAAGDLSAALQSLAAERSGLGAQAAAVAAATQVFLGGPRNATGVASLPATLAQAVRTQIRSSFCDRSDPPWTEADLPPTYQVRTLESAASNLQIGDTYLLSSTGYAAWRLVESAPQGFGEARNQARRYDPNSGTVTGIDLRSGTPMSEGILGLNAEGSVLLGRGGDQTRAIAGQDLVRVWNGTATSVLTPDLAALAANARADRWVIHRGFGPANDGSGRQWVYSADPTFVDGGLVSDSQAVPTIGNLPAAADHCGRVAIHRGDPLRGLSLMDATTKAEEPLAFGTAAPPWLTPERTIGTVLAMNNRGQVVAYAETLVPGAPAGAVTQVGLIKGAAVESMLPNTRWLDINDRTVAVGWRGMASVNSVGSTTVEPDEGVVWAAGSVVPLKQRVPGWANSPNVFVPLRINNAGQMLVLECAANSRCSTGLALHLLSP